MSLSQTNTKAYVHIHRDDNVAVALEALLAGSLITVQSLAGDTCDIELNEDIQQGHKIALKRFDTGENIVKYGQSIGHCAKTIEAGDWVHSHNLETALTDKNQYHYQPVKRPPGFDVKAMPTFMGYRRENGLVGIRNELWIINSVGCVNHAARALADECKRVHSDKADDFLAITHSLGCSQLGDDLAQTRQILTSLASNPNAGGVLFLGLGCESNQLDALVNDLPDSLASRCSSFNAQDVDDEHAEGMRHIEALLVNMAQDHREECSVSDLVVGMKCGGSDGLSGLTANPLLGRISERLSAYGATVVLTETPEMFGAEQVMMNRAVDQQVYKQIVELIEHFKQYFIDNHQPIYENPSPGNKQGGLTTLEEKSLGAIQKGGNAPIQDVIQYGEKATRKNGITLLQAPGNDAISSTALAACGANMVLFTTGRGTPLGVPVPTVKIASNSAMAAKKAHWIDYDAGQSLEINKSLDSCVEEFFQQLMNVASGATTKNETNHFKEIAIWKRGVTL